MCGIVGIASTRQVGERDWLAAGQDAMAHRGPDDRGLWWSGDGRVGLAHLRLSILDLSAAGHQPMFDSESGTVIVFNGEIYNFPALRIELEAMGIVFRSGSDTEVILAAYRVWGVDCLSRLDGMFALALFDPTQQRLLLARDRAGEKPLFYRLADGELRFASELKGLLADPSMPRVIDREAMDCFLSMGYISGDLCILAGYKKLPAAHVLNFNAVTGDCTVKPYWLLPDFDKAETAHESELVDELQQLLEDSVQRQLVADVPVGVLLSGGLDSSLITAMAARTGVRVKTFTIRFPGHGSFDETEHARLIARHFGTEHNELEAQEGTADLMPLLARQVDEPMGDSSVIPTFLVSQLVRQHCKVALGGDGGDELFGGYGYYPKLLAFQKRTRFIPNILGKLASSATERFAPLGVGGGNARAWMQALGTDWSHDLPLIGNFFDPRSRRRLMDCKGALPRFAEDTRTSAIPADFDLIARATRLDFSQYLAEDILVKVDRMSMLNSLELRAPMLDRALIEFAMRKVPSSLKVAGGERKILLKRLALRILPPEFELHRKQGFSIPLNDWLQQGPFRELFHQVLLDDNASFNRSFIQSLLAGQAKGRGNGERLFALVMFELWRNHYNAHF
jgi:asparagine synthase (glutamine-hydrolysing)